MRNLVDNMDLVEAAVEAVREPVFVETGEYKAFFLNIENTLDVLLKVINSQADDLAKMKERIGALEYNFKSLYDHVCLPKYQGPVTVWDNRFLQQSQQNNSIQPININWDAISNSCGESPKLIPTTHY